MTDLSKRLRNEAGARPRFDRQPTTLEIMLREVADELDRLTKALKDADAALHFYANPPTHDEHGEPNDIPDFYDELSFGDRARTALEAISAARARKDAQS